MAQKTKKPAPRKAPTKPQREQGRGTAGAGARPDLRIVAARRDKTGDATKDYTPIAAFWRDPETGWLRGGLDGRIVGVTAHFADGRAVKIATKGERATHFVNAYTEDAPSSGGAKSESAAEDHDDDDIPF